MPDITITLTPPQYQRVRKAFGRYWQTKDGQGGPRDADDTEVKNFLLRQLNAVVTQQERAVEEQKIVIPDL